MSASAESTGPIDGVAAVNIHTTTAHGASPPQPLSLFFNLRLPRSACRWGNGGACRHLARQTRGHD